MLRISRTFASSLAFFAVAAVAAPAPANAWPLGKVFHLHSSTAQIKDTRIDVQLFNKGQIPQDVKVGGHTYTVMPHEGLAIKAPAGTSVYAASTGMGHRNGEMLLALTPDLKGKTIYFN
jgi:murein DD-endopeptidase MepM/ murein hydrolase activator NlpD